MGKIVGEAKVPDSSKPGLFRRLAGSITTFCMSVQNIVRMPGDH